MNLCFTVAPRWLRTTALICQRLYRTFQHNCAALCDVIIAREEDAHGLLGFCSDGVSACLSALTLCHRIVAFMARKFHFQRLLLTFPHFSSYAWVVSRWERFNDRQACDRTSNRDDPAQAALH